MANVFWDVHGVIFIDYLEKGRAITGAYYAAILDRLVDEIKTIFVTCQFTTILFYLLFIQIYTYSNTRLYLPMLFSSSQSIPHLFISITFYLLSILIYLFISICQSGFTFISFHLCLSPLLDLLILYMLYH